jgi:hypothetical protein
VIQWVPPGSAYVFLLYDLAVYLYCAILINVSHEHNCMMSPMSLLSESLNIGMVLCTTATNGK